MLSTELARDVRVGLVDVSGLSSAGCFRSLIRSISSCPLPSVNDRNASNRFRDLKMLLTKVLLPRVTQPLIFGLIEEYERTAILVLNHPIHRLE